MKYSIDNAKALDLHLDMMIRLAFDVEDNEEVMRILNEPDPVLSLEEKAFADDVFAKALAASEKRVKLENRKRCAKAVRKFLIRAAEAAACIILVIGIAMPIAIAHSPAFRAKVMQLIMEPDNEKGAAYFSFVEDEQASFPVPEGWTGQYYPSYIPQGFEVYEYDPLFPMVQYQKGEGQILYFTENTEDSDMMAGLDGSTVEPTTINDYPGYIIDGVTSDGITHTVTIVWQYETRWFSVVSFGISTDETIHVANSVRQIQ